MSASDPSPLPPPETQASHPPGAGPVAHLIHRRLSEALDPDQLQVIDQSHHHVGHAGHDGRGESHFHVVIVAQAFAGLNRVARQRLVYTALAEALADRVHALSMVLRSPAEAVSALAGARAAGTDPDPGRGGD